MARKLTRFQKLEDSLSHRKKAPRNVAAVAATIGRKKYGKKKFEAMAQAGKKRAAARSTRRSK